MEDQNENAAATTSEKERKLRQEIKAMWGDDSTNIARAMLGLALSAKEEAHETMLMMGSPEIAMYRSAASKMSADFQQIVEVADLALSKRSAPAHGLKA